MLAPGLLIGAGAAYFLLADNAVASPITVPLADKTVIDYSQDTPYTEPIINYSPENSDMNLSKSQSNLAAFMALIRKGESSDDYQALVGGGRFYDFANHPFLTGEFKGIKRADGRLTTAAGAYQITKTTWLDLGGLQTYLDFSATSQDAACVDLMTRRGAYDDIINGRVASAITKLRNEWEFFTQAKWSILACSNTFKNSGGILA